MPQIRCRFKRRSVATIILAALASGACERSAPAMRADSASTKASIPDSANTPQASESTWAADAGPAILIEGPSPGEAIVVGPKEGDELTAAVASVAASTGVILFDRGGAQSTAHLNVTPEKLESGCTLWSLRDRAADASTGWAIGFLGNRAKPVALDSVEVLSSRDSMTLVAEVSRLASAVTAPSGAMFQGLRFTAHDIRRFEVAPGVQALVAHVLRRVNQEASPQEEQTLLIAERDSGVTTGPYHLVYAERTSGLEDQVTTPEVIGAANIGSRVTIVVARDNEEGISYSLLERINSHEWRVRWTSKPTTCS